MITESFHVELNLIIIYKKFLVLKDLAAMALGWWVKAMLLPQWHHKKP